jgi:hypothetical protein
VALDVIKKGQHMTNLADTWGINEAQFWLRGVLPAQPVEHDSTAGIWNVYGYPEVLEILSDPATFSSNNQRLVPEATGFAEGNLLQMDPPDHNKLRKLVSHGFTPKVVADLEPRIAALTGELLDAVSDRTELVRDLAYPLPVIVIAELLGVPSSDRGLFKKWVGAMFNSTNRFSLKDRSKEQEEYMAKAMGQVQQLVAYLGEHVAERRRNPREDLLSKLVAAEVDGARLSDAEVANFGMVLLIAGHITTTMLLGNTVLCLDAHPQQFAKVRADRSLVPAAIEESLRFFSPFAEVSRVTNRDVELAGQRIPADEMVLCWIAAANRDARQFADPHVFDIGRDPNPQIGFGRGIHFCLGAPLARLEGRVALNILLDRFPNLRTDPDEGPEFLPSPSMTGVNKLPLLL